MSVFSPQQKSQVSASRAGIDFNERISSIVNATEHLSTRGAPKLRCYNNHDVKHKFAADARYAILEVGKEQDDIMNKNIYKVARKFCSESHGHKFNGRTGKAEKVYWFPNAWKNFRQSVVPVSIRVLDYGRVGRLDGRVCGDMMTTLISGCIADGSSSINHFRGGELSDGIGWVYHIFCNEDYCYG
ncbi:hypothetical protein AJ78_03940 [Emergomyces pasteurianus Ep9510]|uniref:Uncharacterized protein n=1 Tax=Emergomyces pasteurianus Ep9510 TaxID=1447872 RepID=A0A1J9Q6I4_9EURO|nr:hypothetical protein AJ78_03940 [Emergomyces pasteurianus Ep9510]